MSLTYPIAPTVAEALNEPKGFERTARNAQQASGRKVVLETEWLRLTEKELQPYAQVMQDGQTHGYLQVYAGEADTTILAVTFWRETEELAELKPTSAKSHSKTNSASTDKNSETAEETDHADDLYFRQGRTRKRRRKYVDPNQLDLFIGPDQRGFDRRDPNNANIVIAEDEGDGTSFGIAPKDSENQ